MSRALCVSLAVLLWSPAARADHVVYHPPATFAFEDDTAGGDDDFNDVVVRAERRCEFDVNDMLVAEDVAFTPMAAGGVFLEALWIDLPSGAATITLTEDGPGAPTVTPLVAEGTAVELYDDFNGGFVAAPAGILNTVDGEAVYDGYQDVLHVAYTAPIAQVGCPAPQFFIRKMPGGTQDVTLDSERTCQADPFGTDQCPLAAILPSAFALPIERVAIATAYPTFPTLTPGSEWFDEAPATGAGGAPLTVVLDAPLTVLASCDDHVQNADETGVDCGGPLCPECLDPPSCAALFAADPGASSPTGQYLIDENQDGTPETVYCDDAYNEAWQVLALDFEDPGIVDLTGLHAVAQINGPFRSTSQSVSGVASMYFDGTARYLRVADAASLDFGTGDFTVDIWIWLDGPQGSAAGSIHKGDYHVGDGWWLYHSTAEYQNFGRQTWSINVSSPYPGSTPAGAWHHVTVHRQGGDTRLYLDEVFQMAQSGSALSLSNGYPLVIGCYAGYGADCDYPMTGWVDDVKIWKGRAIHP